MSHRTISAPSTRRVLVVDDSAVIRRMLALRLRHAGFNVVEAATGEEALARFRSEPAQVVITDVNMPGRGGFYFLAELRRGRVEAEVILLTSARAADEEAIRRIRRLGVRHVVSKTPAALEAVVLATERAIGRVRRCVDGIDAEEQDCGAAEPGPRRAQ